MPRERVDPADVVDAAVAHAAARDPQATIAFTGPDEVLVDGWPDGLRLLVDNLLDNALRHGRLHGHVDVTLAVDGRKARLTVDDDGPGIPPAERQSVFERFARGDGVRAPGSGLGLALVAQQAAVHRGSAVIEDAPRGGVRVAVELALPQAATPASDPATSGT